MPLTGRLVGRAGHTLNSSVNARAAVDLDVTVTPAPAQRFSFELADTWRPFMLDTAAGEVWPEARAVWAEGPVDVPARALLVLEARR